MDVDPPLPSPLHQLNFIGERVYALLLVPGGWIRLQGRSLCKRSFD